MFSALREHIGSERPRSESTRPNKRARGRATAERASAVARRGSDNPLVSMFLERSSVGAAAGPPSGGGHDFSSEGQKKRKINTQADVISGNAVYAPNAYGDSYDMPNVRINLGRMSDMFAGIAGDDDDAATTKTFGLSHFLGCELNKKSLKEGVQLGFPLPFEFLVMRPFIEHQTYSLVMTKGGSETGATYFGHNNVTLGDDAVSKLHYANLTFYQKSIIHNPKNVYIAEDVYLTGYTGGNGMQIFHGDTDVSYGAEMRDGPRYQKSLFVMLMEEGETQQLRNPVDITGGFPDHVDKFGTDRGNFRHGQHYSTAAWNNAHFQFDRYLQNGGPSNDTDPFIKDHETQNTVCFQVRPRPPPAARARARRGAATGRLIRRRRRRGPNGATTPSSGTGASRRRTRGTSGRPTRGFDRCGRGSRRTWSRRQ